MFYINVTIVLLLFYTNITSCFKKFKRPKALNFLCRHNKCGNLNAKDCNKGIDRCCHHIFNIAFDTEIAKTALIKATFYQTPTGLYDTNHPTLYMKWGKSLTFASNKKGIKNEFEGTAKGFRSWRSNTLRKHFSNYHQGIVLPYCVAAESVRKNSSVRGSNIRYKSFVGKDGERGEQNITSQNVEAMYAVLELEPHST